MKHIFFTLLLAVLLLPANFISAGNTKEMADWQNPEIFERNRLPMSATFVTDQQQTLSLNGLWKFKFNQTIEERVREFQNPDYLDSDWARIPVPGMWEINGWGDPVYVNQGYAWKGHFTNNPPFVAEEHNYVGQYRREFIIDESWSDKPVYLCIGSATSNVRVWVNGQEVGYSEDSKLEARFEITDYVKVGTNIIALEIFRWCDGTYLEDQDFWRMSGIARGVYVYTRAQDRIEDLNVFAEMDGHLNVKARLTKGVKSMEYQVLDKQGKLVSTFSATTANRKKAPQGGYFLETSEEIAHPDLWTAETPILYTLVAKARNAAGEITESTRIRFGFRTIEIKNLQLLVNGQPVLFKGVNRHEVNPYKGYVVSPEDMVRDIKIMKELNINAVRTCHYPDDPMWLQLCDEWGLYVVDEGNIESHGMGYDADKTLANRKDYTAAHLSRDQRMVYRDINHPSVIIWSMGNEAGFGSNFVECYNWMKNHDKTRPVMYSHAFRSKETDIFCPMYPTPENCETWATEDPIKPFIPCEYAHAMGNAMGNFKEYWDLVRKYPNFQGGFIWDFVDQALRIETDAEKYGTDHIYAYGGDFNDYDISDGSFNNNGLLAADRSRHPHCAEVRYQYRNILTSLPESILAEKSEEVNVEVLNEFFFRDLSQYRMKWTVMAAGEPILNGVVENLTVAPQETKSIGLGVSLEEILKAAETEKMRRTYRFSSKGRNASADEDLFINVSYELKSADGLLRAGTEVAYDQLVVNEGKMMAFDAGSASAPHSGIELEDFGKLMKLHGNFAYAGTDGDRVSSWTITFDKQEGVLSRYEIDGKVYMDRPLLPNLDRAPTENDLGAGLEYKFEPWRSHAFVLESYEMKKDGEDYQIDVKYMPIGDYAYITVSYRIHPDGSIQTKQALHDAGKLAEAPDLFRFGMAFRMPGICSDLDFYGYGPDENYVDRRTSQLMGHYQQRVEDQYHYGYVRTQESGTKTGLRWFKISNGNGTGLELTSDKRFSASALPFSVEDLDVSVNDPRPRPNPLNLQAGESRHSLDLKARAHENDRSNGSTYVCLDLIQQGLGGVDSWGWLPLEKYRIHPKEYVFNFVLRPVNN